MNAFPEHHPGMWRERSNCLTRERTSVTLLVYDVAQWTVRLEA